LSDVHSPPDCPSNPLHAAYYADRACLCRVEIEQNVCIARDTYRVRFAAPEIARRIVPGQFVMVRLPGLNDPLLGRPLALYDTVLEPDGTPSGIDVVYLVLGKMTRRLATCRPGDTLEVWGPLGNGFPPQTAKQLIMVAGGIGQTPLLAVAQEYLGSRRYGDPPRKLKSAQRVTLCYGVRTADLAAGVPDFEAAGCNVCLSSNDGTLGHHGLVTDLVRQVLDESGDKSTNADRLVVCCGPEPMMEAVAELCRSRNVDCLVSLETPMACGVGICFSCVAKVRLPDGGWDYKRTCVEGPVFDATKIVW
jgi:dihydroorotate dehydrogenase electron transfer subunit